MIDYEMGKIFISNYGYKKFLFQMPNEDKFVFAFRVRAEGFFQ